MNIYFHIEYHTVFGEELVLNIVRKNEDGKETTAQYRMATTDGRQWTYALNNYRVPATAQGAGDVLDYFYSVDNNGSEERTEWRTVAHRLELKPADALCFHVYDRWIDMPEDSYLYSSAFTDCLRRSRPTPLPLPVSEGSDYPSTNESKPDGDFTPLPRREGQGDGSLFQGGAGGWVSLPKLITPLPLGRGRGWVCCCGALPLSYFFTSFMASS